MGRQPSTETRQVPIPAGSTVYRNGRVLDKGRLYNLDGDFVIGHKVSDTMMIPNENYFRLHMREYQEFAPDGAVPVAPARLNAGFYLLLLTSAQRLGLYPSLVKRFGPAHANAILDYILFLGKEQNPAARLLPSALREEVTFTSAPYDGSWYSRFFAGEKDAMRITLVLDDWIRTCVRHGLSDVWLVLDPYQDAGSAGEHIPGTPGGSMAEEDVLVSGRLWAVCANGDLAGMPLVYHESENGLLHAGSVREITARLMAHEIRVKGIFCGRGFRAQDLLRLLHETGLPWLLELPWDLQGFQTMRTRYEGRLRDWKLDDYAGNGRFGVRDLVRLVSDSNPKTNVALLYDPQAAAAWVVTRRDEVSRIMDSLQEDLRQGQVAVIPDHLRPYMRMEGRGEDRRLVADKPGLEAYYKSGGFRAIAASQEMSAREVSNLFELCRTDGKRFPAFGSPSDGDVRRGRKAASTPKKCFVEFLATILGCDLQNQCRKVGLESDEILRDLREPHYDLVNNQYVYADSCSPSMEKLLAASGITAEDLKSFSGEITRRYIGCMGSWRASGPSATSFLGAKRPARTLPKRSFRWRRRTPMGWSTFRRKVPQTRPRYPRSGRNPGPGFLPPRQPAKRPGKRSVVPEAGAKRGAKTGRPWSGKRRSSGCGRPANTWNRPEDPEAGRKAARTSRNGLPEGPRARREGA